MIGVIPNPTKKITIDFPIDQVKLGVSRIPSLLTKYKIFKQNAAFNSYTLEASEFLSLGVYIDINLSSPSDSKTEINIEVKRKLGAFDTWVEVQNANEHIDKLITGLSQTITMSEESLKNLASTGNVTGKKQSSWPTVVGIIIALIILANLFG